MTKSDLDVRPPSGELLNMLYVFLRDIGMQKEVESINKVKTRDKLLAIFNKLVTNNPYFPLEADVDLMTRSFIDAVTYSRVELKYRNTKGLIDAFKMWSAQDHIRDKFVIRKELPPSKPRIIEEWTDEEISRTVDNLKKIGSFIEIADPNGYMYKIKQEAIKRGIV